MTFLRTLAQKIREKYFLNRAIIIYGARRVGKTTLINYLSKDLEDVGYFNADFLSDREIWQTTSKQYLTTALKNYKYVIIDEAQNIPDIGLVLKILVDNFPDIQVIATGSSSFDIINKTGEPLTGRKWEFYLYPFSYRELVQNAGLLEAKKMLETILVYGLYPEVVLNPQHARTILKEIISSYLLKDILVFDGLKRPDKLITLLKALAYQTGSQVSYNELANLTGLNHLTVERYIDLLEKNFVIFRLLPFSGNLRSELKKQRKIYFWDIGIRNALLNDFTPFHLRSPDEKGRLWENFIIAEQMKLNSNLEQGFNFHFWRTKDGAEIDLVKVKDNQIYAYEVKLYKNARLPKSFARYNPHEFHTITMNNFEEFMEVLF